MSSEDILNSGLLESYVLGQTSESETALVQAMCKTHPELLREIEHIENSLLQLAEQKAPAPSAGTRAAILQNIGQTPATTPTPVKKETRIVGLRWYQLGLAASVLLFIVSTTYSIVLRQKVNQLRGELNELYAAKSYLAQEIKIQQAAYTNIHQQLDLVTDPGTKSIALKGMNTLDGKAAIVYWNSMSHEVYFRANNLPETPADKQYQLWAIVDGKPVDMGVIGLDQTSVFQKMKTVKGAQAFAVTIEKNGGSATPNLPSMCLLGNV